MEYLLSIVVPTIGNEDVIDNTINYLTKQVNKHQKECELIFSFNSCNDGSINIVKKYNDRYPFIKYYQFNERVEAIDSFVRSVELCKGKYILMFGDDDILLPYSLDIILNSLKDNPEVSLLHYNVIAGKDNGDGKIRNVYVENKEFSFLEKLSLNNFLKKHYITPGFISSLVFSREIWNKGVSNQIYKENKGYGFLLILYYGAKNTNCLYYGNPLVIQRNPINRSWIYKWPYYSLIDIPHLMTFLESSDICNNSLETWNKKENKSLLRFIYTLCIAAADKKTYKPLCKSINKYQKNIFRKLLTYLIIYLLPSFMYRIIRKFLYRA